MNGTIRVLLSRTNTLAVGDSIRIWKATTLKGTPKVSMEEGITWDTSRLSEGLLIVSGISSGINELHSTMNPNDIYDLRGRLIRKDATSTDGLPSGIYVRGGKKIVVK